MPRCSWRRWSAPIDRDPRHVRFGPWIVESTVALPDLRPSLAGAHWRVSDEKATLRTRHAHWYQKTLAHDGLPWVWFGHCDDDHVLRFPGCAWCRIRVASREVSCDWQKALDAHAREHLLVNHVLPLAAAAAGFLVFHASVVQRPGGGAIAFVGRVGAGKSTTAAYLGARGWPILSDDRLIVDTAGMAFPIAPYVRVSPTVAARLGITATLPTGHHKVRVPLADHGAGMRAATKAVPLEQVILLERVEGSPSMQRMGGQEGMLALLHAQLQLGMDEPAVQRGTFSGVAAMAEAIVCSRLRLPADWVSLEAVREWLE